MTKYKKRTGIRGKYIDLSLNVKGPKANRVYQLRISNIREEWAKEVDLRPTGLWETVAKTDTLKVVRHKKSDIYLLIDRLKGNVIVLGEGEKAPAKLRSLYRDFLRRRRESSVYK